MAAEPCPKFARVLEMAARVQCSQSDTNGRSGLPLCRHSTRDGRSGLNWCRQAFEMFARGCPTADRALEMSGGALSGAAQAMIKIAFKVAFKITIRRISARNHETLFCCSLLHTAPALTARYPLAPLVGATRLRRIMYNPVPNVSCVVCTAMASKVRQFGASGVWSLNPPSLR